MGTIFLVHSYIMVNLNIFKMTNYHFSKILSKLPIPNVLTEENVYTQITNIQTISIKYNIFTYAKQI